MSFQLGNPSTEIHILTKSEYGNTFRGSGLLCGVPQGSCAVYDYEVTCKKCQTILHYLKRFISAKNPTDFEVF